MNRFLLILGCVLVAVLATLFALPSLIDWSRYRSSFEEQASHLLGRSVRVGEHVRLQLLPTPFISFDNVRVADASGHFDTPLMRMDSFRLQLAVGPLLSGSLVAQDVEMTAPTLRLSVGPDGHGNWVGLGHATAGSGAAELQTLALNAVHIEHGIVELIGATGNQPLRIENISGDLDAPSLQGPYRFKGVAKSAGGPSDLKLSVVREDASGKLHIKSSWRAGPDESQSYSLDGVLADLDGAPSLAGTVEGQFALAATAPQTSKIEFKSGLQATTESASLPRLDLVFDGDGHPQHVTGSAKIGWRDGSASEANLAATALDLDRLAGTTGKPSPWQTVKALNDRLAAAFASSQGAHVQLRIDDATIGGASISGLKLSAKYTDHGLTIDNLSAKLPGQSRLDAAGTVTVGPAAKFDGHIRLWGANAGGLANWALPGLQLADTGNVSTYLIDSVVFADPEHFQADKLRLELSGTTVNGSLRYASLQPQSLSLSLDSGRLDVTQLIEAPLSLALLGAAPKTTAPAGGSDGAWQSLRAVFAGDTHLDLRIGHLITAQGGLRDVSAKLDRTSGRLNIAAIDLGTDDGFRLHVDGALQAKDADGQGQLRLALNAPEAKAMAGAVRFLGLSDTLANQQTALAALAPLTLAGTIAIGGKASASQEIVLDGSAHGSRLMVSLRRDGRDMDWLGSAADVAIEMANTDGGRLLAQLAEGLGAQPLALTQSAPGKLVLRASGVPEDSMTTLFSLETEPLAATFDGQMTLAANAPLGLEGTIGLASKDAATALRLTKLGKLETVVQGPLSLTAQLRRDGDQTSLADVAGTLAGEAFAAQGRFTAASPLAKLEVSLKAPTVRLDRLLGLLIATRDASTVPPSTAAANAPAAPQIWPDRQFDFNALEGLECKIEATTSRLVLTDSMAVADATLTLSSRPGLVELAIPHGRAVKGELTAEAKLSHGPAGATVQVEASLAKARLDALSSSSQGLPRAAGEFGVALKLAGTGLTPRDIVNLVTGKGTFSIAEGSVARFAAGSIDVAARDALTNPNPNGQALRTALAKARLGGEFPMLGATGGLTISDGTIRFDRLKVDSTQSTLDVANKIDLTTLQLASLWTLQPKPIQPDLQALAAVKFNFAGSLADFSKVEPVIDTAALEGDLTARRLLGGPEQLAGVWPAGEATAATAALLPEADPQPMPPVSPLAAQPLTATPPALGAAPGITAAVTRPAATATGLPLAAAATLAGDAGGPAAAAIAAPADQSTAEPPKRPPPQPKPHRKKTNWAATWLQSLFGN